MISLKFPSKTFLLGEYAVLQGGDAFMLLSPPQFELQIADGTTTSPFHPMSEAGKFYAQESEFFKSKQISFIDPHKGSGGFGASGAEFLGLALSRYPEATPWELHFLYRQFTKTSSGVDVLAQAYGRKNHAAFVHISLENNQLSKWLPSPKEDLYLTVLHTGVKQNTHEHLQTNPTVPDSLKSIASAGIEAFKKENKLEFVVAVRKYGEALTKAGLQTVHTMDLVKSHYEDLSAVAAKGCGAMGADVILAITTAPLPEPWIQEKKLSKIYQSWV